MSSDQASLDFKCWTIGKAKITRVLELPPLTADPALFIKTNQQAIRDRKEWLCPDFADEEGNIILHFQAFVIEASGKRILVDPCIGNDKQRNHEFFTGLDGPFLEHLAQAGYPRESMDYVLCTHLHLDHCGWNTMLVDGKWVPTFPNARYLFAAAEYEHLLQDDHEDAADVLEDSVKPIVEAGLAEFVGSDHIIVDEVRLRSTHGHTPGHCSVVISSEGQEAVITGDVIHHPVQVAIPDVSDNFCWNEEMAHNTRRQLLGDVANRGALLLGSHFSGPTGIYLEPDGNVWQLRKSDGRT